MQLSTKYIFGCGAIAALIIIPDFLDLGIYRYLVLGIGIMIVGIAFFYLLFAKESIRGYNLEFEASPDLTHFEVKSRHSGQKTNVEV